MDELDRRSELVMPRSGVAQQRGAGERQHRPHALAAARDQVPGELGDQRDLALHPLEDDGVDAVHVARDERHQRVERRRALGAEREDRCGHGAALAGRRRLIKTAYQTWTRCSGGRYSLSPGWMLNALYQASTFRTIPLTRYFAGE